MDKSLHEVLRAATHKQEIAGLPSACNSATWATVTPRTARAFPPISRNSPIIWERRQYQRVSAKVRLPRLLRKQRKSMSARQLRRKIRSHYKPYNYGSSVHSRRRSPTPNLESKVKTRSTRFQQISHSKIKIWSTRFQRINNISTENIAWRASMHIYEQFPT